MKVTSFVLDDLIIGMRERKMVIILRTEKSVKSLLDMASLIDKVRNHFISI